MNLLLDTHAFLWFCQDAPALSATAKTLIEDSANRKLVSVASCWEIAIKAGLGKLKLGEPSATYIPAALGRTGFELLAIGVAHATGVEALPLHPLACNATNCLISCLDEPTPTCVWGGVVCV